MKKCVIIKLVTIIVLMLCNITFADGWRQTEFGNWQYIENGELVKATSKVIDGVNYYFDTKGNWIPREPESSLKMVGREDIIIEMTGKDFENRKYNTKIKIPMPIVSGDNEIVINNFIRQEYPNVIKKYFEEYYINRLFLFPEIKLNELLEVYNVHNIIGFGYLGGGMFNVYLDYNEMKMWAVKN